MAYNNFIPTVWAKTIEKNLERAYEFCANTNRQYEGTVAQLGDSVRILGVGKPTITEGTKQSFTGLDDAETVEDTSVTMVIDKIAYFNFLVDDIDKRQGVNGFMEAITQEASNGLADVQDRAVANMSLDKLAVMLNSTKTQLTKDNILAQLDLALQKLYENDVKRNTKITITMNPAVYTVFKQAYIDKDTDNSELMKEGAVAKYSGAYVKVSNNVAKKTDSGSDVALIQVKTDKAIAFACPMKHIEPYRPEKKFSDACKGFVLYGAKIVRPKELIVLNGYV